MVRPSRPARSTGSTRSPVPTYQQIKDNPNLQFAEYPDFGYFALYLNQREGTLFSDKNLRQALDYCFDKEATAKAATDNNGVAIYSEIPPASWAYPKDGLNTYPMDPAKGKRSSSRPVGPSAPMASTRRAARSCPPSSPSAPAGLTGRSGCS